MSALPTPEDIIKQRINQQNAANAEKKQRDTEEVARLWPEIITICQEILVELNRLSWPEGFLHNGVAMYQMGDGWVISSRGRIHYRVLDSNDGFYHKPGRPQTQEEMRSFAEATNLLNALKTGLLELRRR